MRIPVPDRTSRDRCYGTGASATVRERAAEYIGDIGGSTSMLAEVDQMLEVHRRKAAARTGAADAVALSKYAILDQQQVLKYWYFDGAPLSVRILYYFGVLEGLFHVPDEQRARWMEFVGHMEEFRAREKALDAVRAVGGWLFAGESEMLWDLAKQASSLRGSYCELGAWLGRSTLIWCNALRVYSPAKRLLVVDNWKWGKEGEKYPFMIQGRDVFLEFKANLAGLDGWYRVYKSLIEDACVEVARDLEGEGLALLFHDANHGYDEVKRDLDQYVPLLNDGGYLIVHDYNHRDFPGVRAAVEAVRSKYGYLDADGVFNTLGIFRRKGRGDRSRPKGSRSEPWERSWT